MFFYEVNNDEPFVHPLSKSKCTSYNGTTIIPKRFCDVKQCEIMRFLNITKTTIEPVSVLVPRKNSTTVFQEDIFPPVPAGVPALSAADWIAGANAPPVLTSMQPPGMASVYQLSKEEGGKDAMSEERKRLRRAASRLQIETTSVGDTTDKPPQVSRVMAVALLSRWHHNHRLTLAIDLHGRPKAMYGSTLVVGGILGLVDGSRS